MNNNSNRNYRNRDSYSSGVTMEFKTKVIVTIILVILAAALCLGIVMSLRKDDNGGDKNNGILGGIFGSDTTGPDNGGNDDPIETKPLDQSCTHEYGTEVKVKTAATCSKVGIGVKTCKKCGGTTEVNISATGNHVYTKYYEATDSTKHYSDCDECGGARIIADHSYKSYTVDATCTVDGKNVSECMKCKAKTEINIKAMGHNVISWQSLDNSQHVGLCTKCGESVKQNHNMGALVEVSSPTCIAQGVKEASCLTCNYKETSTLSATGHTYEVDNSQSVEATCASNGKTVEVCTKCQDTKEIAISGGHIYIPGYSDNTGRANLCDRCGELTYTHIHEYDSIMWHSDPNCQHPGVYGRFCSECRYSETVFNDGETLGDHSYVSGVCEICGASEK